MREARNAKESPVNSRFCIPKGINSVVGESERDGKYSHYMPCFDVIHIKDIVLNIVKIQAAFIYKCEL